MPPTSSIGSEGAPSGSTSAIVAGATSGHHVLRIDGYSRTKHALPNGKHVDSRPFSVAGHTWAIRYYPNGRNKDFADYVSLFLVLKSSRTAEDDVMVQFLFSFADEVKKHKPSYIRSIRNASRFSTENRVWGRTEFVKREDLERSRRLRDDCFTVRCDMIVIGEPQAVASSIVVPPPDWPQHFQALLLSEQGADVRFVVGGEVFAAHRYVLAARSPVFNAKLFGGMKEGTTTEGCIGIDNMLPQVFKCLLHFIYTDSLPEIEESSPVMAQHLLEAADRYDMQRLKLVCEDRLCRSIDVGTVATTLALAEQHHCQGLKEACFNFLKSAKTLDAVKETDGFQHLVKSCPSALFEFMSSLLPADK